jgi:hypothetical protein
MPAFQSPGSGWRFAARSCQTKSAQAPNVAPIKAGALKARPGAKRGREREPSAGDADHRASGMIGAVFNPATKRFARNGTKMTGGNDGPVSFEHTSKVLRVRCVGLPSRGAQSSSRADRGCCR